VTFDNVRAAIHDACQRLVAEDLVSGASGNVSVRLPAKDGAALIAITPSQVPYRVLQPHQVLIIDMEKNVIDGDGRPSSETNSHLAAYRARADLGAVIHSHSPFASALAVAGLDLPPILDEQVVALGGSVPCAEFGMSGSDDLGEKAMRAMADGRAVLLRQHGVLGVGKDLEEAIAVVTQVERTAKIYLLARLLGDVPSLPPQIVELEQKFYRMTHGFPVE
jgi:L-fuculose-phosphate aldolase